MRDDKFTTTSGIVNLHPTKGTHWVIFVNEFYFDSYDVRSNQHSWCKKDRVNRSIQLFYHSGTYAQRRYWHRDANQLKFEVADHQVSGLGSCKERR